MIPAKVSGIPALAESNKCDMTVSPSAVAELQSPVLLPLPDPPLRNADELMANFQHLTISGGALHLAKHFGSSTTTLLADRGR